MRIKDPLKIAQAGPSLVLEEPDGAIVAWLISPDGDANLARARLFAAAPELAAAVVGLLHVAADPDVDEELASYSKKFARRALWRAETGVWPTTEQDKKTP